MTDKIDSLSKKYKYKGFKLISLILFDNTLMGKSYLSYDFIESNDIQDSIYTTVIIGPNGTGKSNLFRIIIDLFKELYDLSNEKQRSYNVDGKFNLRFSINEDEYEYRNIPDTKLSISDNEPKNFLKRNGSKISFKEAKFPIAIIANSIMLTDKYPFYKKDTTPEGTKVDTFPQYKYLGVRNIAQNASTRAYVRKTVEFIVSEFNSLAFRNGLEKAMKFLGLANAIEIFYYTSNTSKFFKENITRKDFDNYFDEIKNKYPNPEDNPPYKLYHYSKIKDDEKLLNSICEYCKKLFVEKRLVKPNYKNAISRKIIFNLLDQSSFTKLNTEFELLEHLRQLGVISTPEIQLKNTEDYSLQESSSGEYHFFSSIVGLMASIKTNSLIFIDEPEISLHPNWQMKYLTFIRELFSNPEYATSHILIATHSHFLISDLKGENSKIIGLKKTEKGKIEIVELPENIDTYCWSPDDVLYNIFNVTSSRNSFVAEEIANILSELSKGNPNKKNKIKKETYDTLIELKDKLKESDPLKEVVKSILKKIN